MILWSFFLFDWILLWLLPKVGLSFGPSQPPVLVLALLRALFCIFPFNLALPFQIIGTILVIYGFWIEPHRIHVTHRKLITQKFHSPTPLRILQLGDLHIERITKREIQLNQLVKTLKPDLILFSGDILNLSYRQDREAQDSARKIMAEWQAPLGVFSVSGSPAVDLKEIMSDLMQDLPIRWLNNERVTLHFQQQPFDLVGLSCTHRPYQDAPVLQSLLKESSGNFTILLYHSPDLAPDASESGIDLQLSGHTHGGQVRVPLFGAIYSGSLYGKRFEKGSYLLGEMLLYVTRGIGMEGAGAPRVRFLCSPEIILWEISAPTGD